MFEGPIARRVKLAMNQRIKDAEEMFSQTKKTIAEDRDVKVQEVEVQAAMDTKKAEDALVESIIGK
jgi:hypothetical protein